MLDLPRTELALQRAERELESLGYCKSQLEGVSFWKPHGFPFSHWSVNDGYGRLQLGSNLRPLKVIATVRWLNTDPPHDRDFEDACQFLELYLLEPDIEAGRRHRAAQQQRSRLPRDRLTDDGSVTRSELISKLVQHHADLRPKELWPHFLSALDDEALGPVEKTSGKDGSELQVHFGKMKNGKPRTLTLRRFAKLMNEERNKKAR